MSHADDPTDASESSLATAVADSRVVAVLGGLDDRLSSFGRGERAARLGAWVRRVVTSSFAYHWLTAEPEPDVIVIDLRETVTVGPFVALLDRFAGWLDAAAESSSSVVVGRGLLAEFRAAPVRLLGAAVALGSSLTLFVGAVLGVVGAIVTVVLAAIALAGLAGTQVTISWADLADSRVGQLVIAALEPPTDSQPVDANDRDE
ncbi:hypothetical protein [Salinigranum salinum]|uniref:hypothetical protein n=1 Tax=Salinigranum salinum TaxID=1364937 RepID=UPI001260A28C|nr:hypothetical protein [Salinigranum salinum]